MNSTINTDVFSSKKKNSGKKIFSLFFLFIFLSLLFSCGKEAPAGDGPKINKLTGTGTIKLPLTSISDGKAHFYSYAHAGKDIRFFILKSGDGTIRAAFDACDVCWRAGKGYYQENNSMVCRNCGRRFASELINEVKGGCNPAPLTREIQGENLEIQSADIIAGAGYFDL